jgi:hypothetical protein
MRAANATRATTSATPRREPPAQIAGSSPRTCRTLLCSLAANLPNASRQPCCETAERFSAAPPRDRNGVVHATASQVVEGHARGGRDEIEHRRRAHEPAGSRRRLRGCARQVRGESRVMRPRDRERTRHAPRPLQRHGANHQLTSRAPPREPAGRFCAAAAQLRATTRDARVAPLVDQGASRSGVSARSGGRGLRRRGGRRGRGARDRW